MHVIWHDDPTVKLIKMAGVLSMQKSSGDHGGNPRLSEPRGGARTIFGSAGQPPGNKHFDVVETPWGSLRRQYVIEPAARPPAVQRFRASSGVTLLQRNVLA